MWPLLTAWNASEKIVRINILAGGTLSKGKNKKINLIPDKIINFSIC